MGSFKSWRSYFHFQRTIRTHTRYFFGSDVQYFLDTLLETAGSRVLNIDAEELLWRSQLGHDWEPYYEENAHADDVPCPYDAQRMAPIKWSAIEGRANPKGIPYLYLSTDHDTALAEVRPWIGSYISLGQFKLLKDIKLINFKTVETEGFTLYFNEPSPKKRELEVWRDIDRAFAQPVTPNENSADYVPTQVIAELFKNNGFDGIAYRSSLGEGYNIVLFDLDVADMMHCTLYEAAEISFNFKSRSNTYFQKEYYK